MSKVKELESLLDINEMANAISKYTGLDGVLYFCTSSELKNKQAHALGRVKLRKNNESVSCSIRKIGDKYKTEGKNTRMINQLIKFVDLNWEILWEYWLTDPMKADSAETMKCFKRIN